MHDNWEGTPLPTHDLIEANLNEANVQSDVLVQQEGTQNQAVAVLAPSSASCERRVDCHSEHKPRLQSSRLLLADKQLGIQHACHGVQATC
jgi:hypothetical protein